MPRPYVQAQVWANTEDVILTAAISKYGLHNWFSVSTMLTGKTPAECKARWYEYLSPNVKKDSWTVEEEQKLVQLTRSLPNQWQTIAAALHRTADQCLTKFKQLSMQALGQKQKDGDNKDDQGQGQGGDNTSGSKDEKFNFNVRPEHRAARPDAHDFDERERELLHIAQARLANTRGKKDQRRMRETLLKDSKEAAKLARLRQLEAAGVKTKVAKDNEMDLLRDVKRKNVQGEIFDTTAERLQESLDKQAVSFVGKKVVDIEGLTQTQRAALAKHKAVEKDQELKKTNLPAYIMKQTMLNDNIVLQQRGQLVLPGADDDNSNNNAVSTSQQHPSLIPGGGSKRKLPHTDDGDFQITTKLASDNNDINNISSNIKRQRTGTSITDTDSNVSLEAMLTNLDQNLIGQVQANERASAILDLSSKLAALPSANVPTNDDLASKLANLDKLDSTTINQTNISRMSTNTNKSQTTQRPHKVIKNVNNDDIGIDLSSVMGNLDTNLKNKIIQFQQQRQQQQLITSHSTSAKNSALLGGVTGQGPQLPRLFDNRFVLHWPLTITHNTTTTTQTPPHTLKNNNLNVLIENNLNDEDRNAIETMLHSEFSKLVQSDMTNSRIPQSVINDIKLGREIVAQEEIKQQLIMDNQMDGAAVVVGDGGGNNKHFDFNVDPIYFNPIDKTFISLNNDTAHKNKKEILRQQAFLQYRWLSEILQDNKTMPRNNQQQQPPPQPHVGRLKDLERQLSVEFKGYIKKNKHYTTEFEKLFNKSRELHYDFYSYNDMVQHENQSIHARADEWSVLYDKLQSHHNDLQQYIYKLLNKRDE